MLQNSDNELIARYLGGDEKSLALLIEEYLRPIYGFVYRFMRNSRDAEDVTQETFVRMWRNLKKFDASQSFKAWLFTIARNAALDALKKKKTIPFSDTVNDESGYGIAETLIDPAAVPAVFAERKEMQWFMAGAIAELPEKYRVVVALRHDEDLNFREIAERLRESVNTVKSRYRRALLLLKKAIGGSAHQSFGFRRNSI